MTTDDPMEPTLATRSSPMSTVWVLVGVVALIGGGYAAYSFLKPPPTPPPVNIADDPLLVQGRTIFLERCVSCHGPEGKGDGPIAKAMTGPPPGDLTDDEWKHGDEPEEVLNVINNGIKDASMAGWRGIYNEEEIRGLAAYVYYLAGREVPEELRQPQPKAD